MNIRSYLLFRSFDYIFATEGDEGKSYGRSVLLPAIVDILAVPIIELLQVINIVSFRTS